MSQKQLADNKNLIKTFELANLENTPKRARTFLLYNWAAILAFLLAFYHILKPQDNPSTSTVGEHAVLGAKALLTGITLYFVAYLTRCLTFRFNKPFYTLFQYKLLFLTILLIIASCFTVVSFEYAVLIPIFKYFELNTLYADLTIFLLIFPILFLLSVRYNFLLPITKRAILARFNAMQISQEEINQGILTGLPTLNKKREGNDDIGLLRIDPDCIRFRGDSQEIEITKNEYLRLEYHADKHRLEYLLGGIKPVIVYHEEDDDTERRICLQVEDYWTLSEKMGAQNALIDRIKEWEQQKSA